MAIGFIRLKPIPRELFEIQGGKFFHMLKNRNSA